MGRALAIIRQSHPWFSLTLETIRRNDRRDQSHDRVPQVNRMLRAWRKKQDPATQAMAQGDLTHAVALLQRKPFRKSHDGRKTARQLTRSLIERAGQATERGNLQQAWTDLYAATEVALSKDTNHLAREKTHLVELTIEQADSFLTQAKITAALDTVALLNVRKIPDRRADEILQASQLIQSAEESAACGNLTRSTRQIEKAQSLRPDLRYLDPRKDSYRVRLRKLSKLNNELRGAFAVCDWTRAKTLAGKILAIAPKYKIALDATQQCQDFLKGSSTNRKPKLNFLETIQQSEHTQHATPTQPKQLAPAKPGLQSTETAKMKIEFSDSGRPDSRSPIGTLMEGCVNASVVNQQPDRDSENRPQGESKHSSAETPDPAPIHHVKNIPAEKIVFVDDPPPAEDPFSEFLMWVDGVGGFLVCPSPVNSIGQAIEQTAVEIPIVADVLQEHVRIELIEGSHLLYPLGSATVNGLATCPEPGGEVTLRDGHVVSLDGGVEFKFIKQHPLSPTARLDFTSRHRTRPWSDGVILAAQSIILGPDRRNHIFCPFWENDIVLFRQSNQWFCRAEGKFEVDGKIHEGAAPINFASRISGADFSFSLEPVRPGGHARAK